MQEIHPLIYPASRSLPAGKCLEFAFENCNGAMLVAAIEDTLERVSKGLEPARASRGDIFLAAVNLEATYDVAQRWQGRILKTWLEGFDYLQWHCSLRRIQLERVGSYLAPSGNTLTAITFRKGGDSKR